MILYDYQLVFFFPVYRRFRKCEMLAMKVSIFISTSEFVIFSEAFIHISIVA